MSQEEAAELAEWLADFYLKEKGSVAAELQQGESPGFGAENTWAEQMKQDLANIFAYLTQLDHTLTQHKEEILNLSATQEGGYGKVADDLKDLQLTVTDLMEQFAAYEKNYSGGQVITAEEFGNIRMKLEQVQKEIGTAQSELTDTLQALDSNNAKGQESIKNRIHQLEASARDHLDEVNKNITKILGDLKKADEGTKRGAYHKTAGVSGRTECANGRNGTQPDGSCGRG